MSATIAADRAERQARYIRTSRGYDRGFRGMRAVARTAARRIALSTLVTYARLRGRDVVHLLTPRVQFLYLHHVFADEERGFRRLLECLPARGQRIIGYSEAVARILAGRIEAPYVCFSFDDGLKTCRAAGRILAEFGVSACFFVCPPMVGETRYSVVREFCRRRLRGPAAEFLDWNDVEALQRQGHEIGSHTLSHVSLRQLSSAELHDEIAGSREELRRRLGTVEHFAWPFGTLSHFSAAARRAVRAAGYRSCASGVRGCHTRAPLSADELCIRRDHLLARWRPSDVLFFMARNAADAPGAISGGPTTSGSLDVDELHCAV